MASNAQIIRGGYEAFTRRDLADLFSRFAPDIEWVTAAGSPYGLGGAYKGHEEVGGFFGKVSSAYGEDLSVNVEESLESGDRVVVFGTFQARSASGAMVSTGFVHSWTLSDGKAIRMVECFDTLRWTELLAS
jgi:ketosteroid isomerase-like protein